MDTDPLTEKVKSQTFILRQQYRMKLPDVIIAATAQAHDVELLTKNTKDFEFIGGLTLAAWPEEA